MATKKQFPAMACAYRCGNNANGTLMVNYTPFASDDDSYRRGMSFAFPCCNQCAMGAVTFAIKLPEKKA